MSLSVASTRAAVAAGIASALAAVAEVAGEGPLHVHLSEQPAENADCLAATGLTPTALLAEHGFTVESVEHAPMALLELRRNLVGRARNAPSQLL